jgi:hypothetical protein
MQAQLSRQFKQDKKLQKEKEHRKEAERIVGSSGWRGREP